MADSAGPRPKIILNEPGKERSAPRIILSGIRRGEDAASLNLSQMDWERRFGGRSPLARKVITFNLVSLVVLVLGVLYLNQFQDGLLLMQERSMRTEGQLIVSAIREKVPPEGDAAEVRQAALTVVQGFADSTTNRLWLYDEDQNFIGGANTGGTVVELVQVPGDGSQSAFTAIAGELWDRAARLIASNRSGPSSQISSALANPVARQAIDQGRIVSQEMTSSDGQLVLTLGVPLEIAGQIRGALTLTTPPGEIDNLVRREREQTLQVFALAILCSVLLSLVLANTIVRPLRYLAEAAQESGMRTRRKKDHKRVDMPDLTGRPDEIGFLSGAMQAMTTALYDRIEANEMFAADVAHEIKNPLTSLRSAVETMPYAKDEEQRGRLLDVIKQDVDRLNRLVTDISNASRLDSELVRDEMDELDLHGLLRELVEFNQTQSEEVGAELVTDFSDKPLMIQGLGGRLAQVFVNLITNALSFATEGDRIVIRTSVPKAGVVRVTVEDQGPGIPDENLADIFSRFYSERPQKEAFGNHSGLGLAISLQIVEAHGGQIWAENIRPEGAGTDVAPDGARMIVELPV
ncbi:ATP-binding protein [Algicella marina]|uniref:histidine kinase n=1 Tax=Algicella marina TaxID=2683284 RepID=A0A6P1T737_9RHOB|nr:ATP-binding protein [Algicella marina]QHQ37099.1 HAMP domain-containing protein [Algicella marina]